MAAVQPQRSYAKVKLNKTKATITVGKTLKFKVSGAKRVKWSSNKKSVATVSSKGLVKAKKTGRAKIKKLTYFKQGLALGNFSRYYEQEVGRGSQKVVKLKNYMKYVDKDKGAQDLRLVLRRASGGRIKARDIFQKGIQVEIQKFLAFCIIKAEKIFRSAIIRV